MSKKIYTGLIGHPVLHSKSPAIHLYWAKKYGIDLEYSLYDIHPDNLKDQLFILRDKGLRGLNVTIPHKCEIRDFCDHLDDSAISTGAVNVMSFESDGSITGANTDAYGFMASVKSRIEGFTIKNKTAIVIGAGGAAGAVVYALLNEGAGKVIIANRTIEKAQHLAVNSIKPSVTEVIALEKINDYSNEISLLVNATSVGMTKNCCLNIDIDFEKISRNAVINDIVYSPLMTPLLVEAKKHGLPFVKGSGMLAYQACKAFEIWHGVLPEVTEDLYNIIEKPISD